MPNIPILRRTNLLAFPNRNPGFDPSHPASNGCICSWIPAPGGNAINLLTAKIAIKSAAFSTFSITPFGPGLTPATSQNEHFTGLPTTVTTTGTVACICTVANASSATQQKLIVDSVGTGPFLVSSLLKMFNGVTVSSGLTIGNNPYFFAITSNTSTGAVKFLVLNLATGQVTTATSSSGGTTAYNFSSLYIGINASANNDPFTGSLNCGMVTSTELSMPQLLQWAADPWAFWCPYAVFDSFDWVVPAQAAGLLGQICL